MNTFTVRHIHAGYGTKTVLHDISFAAERGTVLGIAGPNGSGKSTLLKSICNILPHQGCCGFDLPSDLPLTFPSGPPSNPPSGFPSGLPSDPPSGFPSGLPFEQMNEKQLARLCSYLPQKSGLTLNLRVLDTVLMAYNPVLGLFSAPTGEMTVRALKAIEETGLKGKENTGYLCLSGGERRLCLLARALLPDTPLLVMDEPEGSLDPAFRVRIMETMRKRVREHGNIAVISIHDINLAFRFCDRILLIKEGKTRSVLDPAAESENELEHKLSDVFGSICVKRITDKEGTGQPVMICKSRQLPLA